MTDIHIPGATQSIDTFKYCKLTIFGLIWHTSVGQRSGSLRYIPNSIKCGGNVSLSWEMVGRIGWPTEENNIREKDGPTKTVNTKSRITHHSLNQPKVTFIK